VLGLEGHKIIQISAGGTHTLTLSSKNRMFVWGRAAFGRLGLGNLNQDLYSPVECCLPGKNLSKSYVSPGLSID